MKGCFALLSVCLVLVMTACGADASSPSTDETASTTASPTRPAASVVEVTDVYTGELTLEGDVCTFHVPQVRVSGEPLTALNETMYRELYDGVLVHQVFAEEGESAWSRMNYVWGENDDIVSVVVGMTSRVTGNDTYLAFSASKKTGEVITDRGEVAAYYGLTEELLDAQIAAALEMEYVMSYQSMIPEMGQEIYDEKLALMLDEMVFRAEPFVSAAGDLCVVADLASFEEADYYKVLLNVTGGGDVQAP